MLSLFIDRENTRGKMGNDNVRTDSFLSVMFLFYRLSITGLNCWHYVVFIVIIIFLVAC